MSRRPMMLCLLLMTLATSACAASTTAPAPASDYDRTAPASDYCAIAKPITYDSKADTAETVKQVEAANSQYACVCDDDCPKVKDRPAPNPAPPAAKP